MSARRSALQALKAQNVQHTGLWLDKFLSSHNKDDKEARSSFVGEVAQIKPSKVYPELFNRWEQSLQNMGAITREITTAGRMVVGLGIESVLETSISLHRTYGVPFIPGSAIKGLLSHYAHQRLEDSRWRKGQSADSAHRAVFGSEDMMGHVTFFDALPVKYELHQDVMTVHHPEYYQGEDKPPADWDSPNPVPFLSASGTFLLAFKAPEAWEEVLLELCDMALDEYGIGGKTSSGYGRFVVDPNAQWRREKEGREKKQKEAREKQRREQAQAEEQQKNLAWHRSDAEGIIKYIRETRNVTTNDMTGRVQQLKGFELPADEKKHYAQQILEELKSKRLSTENKKRKPHLWHTDLQQMAAYNSDDA